MRDYKYPLFLIDFDGVIVNSEPLNYKCWRLAYQAMFNVEIHSHYQNIVGLNLAEIHWFFCRQIGLSRVLTELEKKVLINCKNNFYYDLAVSELTLMDGLLPLLDGLLIRGCRLAVVSAALKERLLFTLKLFEIDDYFSLIHSAEDSTNNLKSYQSAIDMLSSESCCCGVIEDSPAGINVAKTENIYPVYALTTTYSHEQLQSAGADVTVDSLVELKEILLREPLTRKAG